MSSVTSPTLALFLNKIQVTLLIKISSKPSNKAIQKVTGVNSLPNTAPIL